MKYELFTLCDGAFNYSGRLSIVGTYDNVAAKSLPWTVNLAFAMKLFVDKNEFGNKQITLCFLNPDKNQFAADIHINVNIPSTGAGGHIAFTSALSGVSFLSFGTHSILIKENNEVLKEFFFDVVQS